MRVVIAGGTGLIGRALTARLIAEGHTTVILSRSAGAARPGVTRVAWTPDGTTGPWATALEGADAVVNLTGAGMADRRWTPSRKAELLSSRVRPTRSLVAAIRSMTTRPSVFVHGVAVGVYGTAYGAQAIDESFAAGRDFAAELCREWEAAAQPAVELGCRLVTLRSGVVFSADGGILSRLRLPFLLFAGGPIATGQQYISWIHEQDLVSMIMWALTTPAPSGVINATSPEPVTNKRFSAALGRALHRPSLLPVPAFALRLLFGEMADVMLIRGQRVVPKRALELGFRFRYPDVEQAVAAAVSG